MLNVALVVIVAVLMTGYSWWHLRRWLSLYTIGGGVSILVLGAAIFGILKKALGHDVFKPLVAYLLKARWVTAVLAVMVTAIGFLFAVTSSINIELSSPDGTAVAHRVLIEPAIAGVSSLSVDKEDKTAGHAFFFRRETVPVILQLADAPQYGPLPPRDFHRWTSMFVRVPRDFPRKIFRLVRLIPGVGLSLPLVADSAQRPYRLEVTRMAPRGEEKLAEIHDWRMQPLHLGASSQEISHVFEEFGATDESVREPLARYLTIVDPGMPDMSRAQYIAYWTSPPSEYASKKYETNDKLRIRLLHAGTAKPLLMDQQVTIGEDTVATWFVEVMDDGSARIVDSTRQPVH